MNKTARRFGWWIWVGLALTLAVLSLAFLLAHLRLRAFLGDPLPVYGSVLDFNLTNQLGQPMSLADLRGHVWVADIIFTRCAGSCLKMSRQMKEIQDALPQNPNVRLISLTTDPRFDVPSVLDKYAQRFGADPKRWMFLTGSQQEIANLATNSLKLFGIENKPEERQSAADLFLHSTTFVIVDKHAQLRRAFETTGEDIDPKKAKARILAAIHRLEREP